MTKKRIFISCGQRTPEEKIFGGEIQAVINQQHMDGFFAEYAHDAADLNTAHSAHSSTVWFRIVATNRKRVGSPII
jgi:hypothetical protein